MKAVRILVAALIFTVLFGSFQSARAAAPQPFVKAEAGILIDANTGKVLYAKNAELKMYPASTTKIITALLALEKGIMSEIVTVGNEVNMIAWDSSRAHLKPGDKISLRDLLHGLMLASGNDAAYTVAVHIARTVYGDPEMPASVALKEFAALMNERAVELGATNTNFVNPDGYPNSGHYTTARDLALIAAGAMANPDFRELDSAVHFAPETWVGSNARTWTNGNALVNPRSPFFYDKALGGKTGFTFPAGFCMVATAGSGNMELVAVALKTDAKGRWNDTTALLEYGFQNFTRQILVEAGDVVATVRIAGSNRTQDLIARDSYIDSFDPSERQRIETRVQLTPELADLSLDTTSIKTSVEAGETAGELVFSLDGQELHRVELTVGDFSVVAWLGKIFAWIRH